MASKTAKYPVRCCVNHCQNTSTSSPALHFYRFPKARIYKYKQERLNQWIAAVSQHNSNGSIWKPYANSRICSRHFVGNEKSENPLSPSYNPTIFPIVDCQQVTLVKNAPRRCDRTLKRKRIEESGKPSRTSKAKKLALKERQQDCIKKGSKNKVEETTKPMSPEKRDYGTQVYLTDDDISDKDENRDAFMFKRYPYIHASKKNYRMVDAEVQVHIPKTTNNPAINVETAKTANKYSGTNVPYKTKAVGLEVYGREAAAEYTAEFHQRTSIKNDERIRDLAGVTIQMFELLMSLLPNVEKSKVSKEKRLEIFLIKMKCGLTYSALSVLFCVHRKTVKRIFLDTLKYLAGATREFVLWPSRKVVQATMPSSFRETYKNCRAIIGCTEFVAEQPSCVQSWVQLDSHCKKTFTLKILIGCTPSGKISFVSKCYGGRTTDAQIASTSGFLDLLEPTDLVLSDKGFTHIKIEPDESGPFLDDRTFTAKEGDETYEIRIVRFHIERIVQRLRTYRILNKFTSTMLRHSNDIVFMCCVLINLQPPITEDSDAE